MKIHCHFLRASAAISLIILTACAGGPREMEAEDYQANLVLDVGQRIRNTPKYPMTLGVMLMRDQRLAPFLGESDSYFRQPVPEGLSRSLYFSLNRSGLFNNVEFINETPKERMSATELRQIGEQHQVDLILFADLTTFNFVRRSLVEDLSWFAATTETRQAREQDFEATVALGFIGQILHVATGTVVWGEEVQSFESTYAAEGAISPTEFNDLTDTLLAGCFTRLAQFIDATGLVPR